MDVISVGVALSTQLIDHGLYVHLSDTERRTFADVWRDIVLTDDDSLQKAWCGCTTEVTANAGYRL